jgi:hypothetical protein
MRLLRFATESVEGRAENVCLGKLMERAFSERGRACSGRPGPRAPHVEVPGRSDPPFRLSPIP